MTYESKHSKNSEYLGILILPPKANIKSVSTHLASLTRLDAKNIEYRLRGGTPAIIGSVTPKEAREAIQWMTNHTIESASTNDQELLSRGKPTVVKDIEINEGQLSIEMSKIIDAEYGKNKETEDKRYNYNDQYFEKLEIFLKRNN